MHRSFSIFFFFFRRVSGYSECWIRSLAYLTRRIGEQQPASCVCRTKDLSEKWLAKTRLKRQAATVALLVAPAKTPHGFLGVCKGGLLCEQPAGPGGR